jgi:diguanylate cyclase (GGDEF)-like protein
MPPQETLLIVIFVAIAANLALGLALLLVPRLRGRARPTGNDVPTGPLRQAGEAPRFDLRPPAPAFVSPTSQTDPQTGLDLASTWARWLREEDARIRRYRNVATVVLVEVEGLERLVERLGSEAADRLLPPVATTMRRHGREADRVARLGTGRFGALLPETSEAQAIHYVERVRETCDRWLAAGAISLLLSIGWAEANAGRSMDLAQQAAEERLNAERHRDPPPPASPQPLDSAARPSPAN